MDARLVMYNDNDRNNQNKPGKDDKRDGEQLVDKHIYANPLMTEICPILGLTMYLLVYPQVGTRKSKRFFPGKDTHVRFNVGIQKAIANPSFRRYLINRGIPFHNVGAYSTRKGASTYCTSGATAGLSVVVVCQRAGWSMGPTLDSKGVLHNRLINLNVYQYSCKSFLPHKMLLL